ncbi:MAG: hypothetical protein LBD20_06285 [Spirochaetaceae bacterium]|jgi:prefoldin subunit 5|nr:hypothetical protein [Spirochaetaceae bacterium]
MAEMTAEQAAEWGKTLDFPTVWATVVKIGEKVDKLGEKVDKTTENINDLRKEVDKTTKNVNELRKEVDKTTKNVNELRKEVDKTTKNVNELKKEVDKTTKTVRELSRNVGGLNGSMGELIETLFAPHLGEKFDAWHYDLKRSFARVPIYDDTSRQRGDIDILLSNTTVCMPVEVKRWLDNTEKVDEHIKRMALIRQYPPAETKGKRLIGAIAAAVVYPEVREYAEKTGFFVLELTGEDIRLLDPPENFQPKEW